MAQLPFHKINRNYTGALVSGVDAVVTSWVIDSITAPDTIETPYYLKSESEWVEVTVHAVDTPVAGQATLTVVRGVKGTSAASHATAATVAQLVGKWEQEEQQERAYATEAIAVAGGTDGVQRDVGGAGLRVDQQLVEDLTVQVQVGAAAVSGQPVALQIAFDTSAFTPPTTNPRIDIVQIDQYGDITSKTGTEAASPSAPTVDTDNLKLCEIYHRVGETSIKDTDDSTNGYITDTRAFL